MTNLGAFKLQAFRQRGGARPAAGQKALTQAEVAGLVGCTAGMISFLENGIKQPSLALASRLEKIGVCDASDFLRPASCRDCKRALDEAAAQGCDNLVCPFRELISNTIERAA